MHKQVYFNWSSGKDSALALHYLLQDKNISVGHLLTTINETQQRVSMHGVRRSLLEVQLKAIELPYSIVAIPEQCINTTYETIMQQAVAPLISEGFEYAAFGDIFLEDLKLYREQQLAQVGLKGWFPLWQRDSRSIVDEFIDLGFKAITVSVNAQHLDASFVGRVLDHDFIKDLPAGVDPAGENGEFHTFCFEAPYFKAPVDFTKGEKVYRTYQHGTESFGYWFCDLLNA
ncbi:MAG: adenine nucleotide alpha hydrolase [Taibaiella sp.]|nr:adenine nucleotide alpha hydrolase [Taibaiella sp.]